MRKYVSVCSAHAELIKGEAEQQAFTADCMNRARSVMLANAALSLAGEMVLAIPEYHDEQAFPTHADGFGPVAYFFASPYLGSITREWQVDEQGTRGMLAAIINVDTTEGVKLQAPYDALNLRGGVNCLWLTRAAGNWKAWISQTGIGVACDSTSTRAELAVRAEQRDIGHSHYPAVTRFTEAAASAAHDLPAGQGQPLLSVKCIDRWCEIGPKKADGSPDFHVADPMGGAATREHRIKGWHDEQWVAVKGTNGDLRPGFRAAFVPEPRINEKSAATFDNRWTTVATVILNGAPPTGSKYEKIGLRDGRNRLQIRRVSGAWEGQWVYFGAGAPPPRAVAIKHMPHYDAAVPGTARFRWQSTDDSLWAPCGQACCRVEPIS